MASHYKFQWQFSKNECYVSVVYGGVHIEKVEGAYSFLHFQVHFRQIAEEKIVVYKCKVRNR